MDKRAALEFLQTGRNLLGRPFELVDDEVVKHSRIWFVAKGFGDDAREGDKDGAGKMKRVCRTEREGLDAPVRRDDASEVFRCADRTHRDVEFSSVPAKLEHASLPLLREGGRVEGRRVTEGERAGEVVDPDRKPVE